jgi:transposase InsO family protein
VPGYASAQELADAALPGLPTTKRSINRRAETDGWQYIDRVGRGGGRLYRVADLPIEAQQALLQQRISAASGAPVGRPKGSDYFTRNPEVAAAVEAILASRRLAAPGVMELLQNDFVTLPSLRSLRRFIAKLEEERKTVILSMRDPDAFKSKYRVSIGRADANTAHAHQIWEIDATKADVMTTEGRKMILGLIDRWSRRVLFMVCPSESAQSVRRLLITAIERWGVVPEIVMTDQGSGFINGAIVSALEMLGIEHWPCPPASGDKKPHIERVFGTFQRQRTELFDGYLGHSVAEAQQLRAKARKDSGRPVIEARMSAAELQAALDNWTDGVYHLREHGSLRMSPMRKWQSSPVPARAAPGAEVLRMALSALVGARTVGKRGIQWQGGRYWSPALAPWVARQVLVRRDEDELGELLVFSPEGEFIDIAVNHARSGLSEAEFAAEARAQQARWLREQRADLKARAKDFNFERARDAILRRDAEAAGKLVQLPMPTQTHSTPAIDTLSEAAGSPAPQPARRERPAAATIVTMPKSPAVKMREADAIIARADAGEAVDADALRRARLYASTSEYRAQRAVAEHLAAPTSKTSA